MMQRYRYTLAVLVMSCYLLGSSTLVHAASMQLTHLGVSPTAMTDQSVVSDCGMQMADQSEQSLPDDCFERCFGSYDELFATKLTYVESTTHIPIPFIEVVTSGDREKLFCQLALPPPDDRQLIVSTQTPYFSHHDTTKRE